jgi:hypothetical protein
LGYLDVHDLVVEQPVLGRRGGALVGHRRELVLFGAADLALLVVDVSRRAHPELVERAEQGVVRGRVDQDRVAVPVPSAGPRL